eukprot:2759874-Amphidinium_carterae.1
MRVTRQTSGAYDFVRHAAKEFIVGCLLMSRECHWFGKGSVTPWALVQYCNFILIAACLMSICHDVRG